MLSPRRWAPGGFDLVICEAAFLGALRTCLTVPPDRRVPLLAVSSLPITLTIVDCAPFGTALPSGRGTLARARNRLLNTVVHAGPLRPLQTALDAASAEVGAPPATGRLIDQVVASDHVFQLSTPGLEYPRRELPAWVQVRRPAAAGDAAQPGPALVVGRPGRRPAGRPRQPGHHRQR